MTQVSAQMHSVVPHFAPVIPGLGAHYDPLSTPAAHEAHQASDSTTQGAEALAAVGQAQEAAHVTAETPKSALDAPTLDATINTTDTAPAVPDTTAIVSDDQQQEAILSSNRPDMNTESNDAITQDPCTVPTTSQPTLSTASELHSDGLPDKTKVDHLSQQLHNDPNGEWEVDSSEADSTSSSDSDSCSSDDDTSDDDYELLDPATAAKMLMAGEEGADDDDGQQTSQVQVRTKNEKPPELIPRPDVVITADTKLTPLGRVVSIVDTYVLIKAQTDGSYQVLEQGSVLCLENRTILGAVAETLGRVEEPMYAVAFTTRQEIDDYGVVAGANVLYADQHSTFVFTQPLRNHKGTDASNLHDEEPGQDEMEFSDDEAEAAYKRAKKEAKKGGRGKTRTADGNYPAHILPPNVETGPINYGGDGDDSDGDDMYTPLSRPTEMSHSAQRLPPQRSSRGRPGRGDGSRSGITGRGGRGDGNRQRNGPSRSFPDQHNINYPQHSFIPPITADRQSARASPVDTPVIQPGLPQWPANSYTQASGYSLPQQQHSYHSMPQQPQQTYPQLPHTLPQLNNQMPPAGAFLNPSFFLAAQQLQQQQQQQQQMQHRSQQAQYNAPTQQDSSQWQHQQLIQQQQQDLLRRLQQQTAARPPSSTSVSTSPVPPQSSLQNQWADQNFQQQLDYLKQTMTGQR